MAVPDAKDDFIHLLLQHRRQIYGYVRSLVPNAVDAEDLLQDISAVLWRKFEDFELGTNFLAWAMQIAWFEVKCFHRNQKRQGLRFNDEILAQLAAAATEECQHSNAVEDALHDCLSSMAMETRELLLRRYESNTTIAEIAEGLGRPLETVRSMLKRIRHVLFECIQRKLSAEARS